MRSIDLSNENVENLCHSFTDLRERPAISISVDAHVNILFFKRKDKYLGIRTGLIAEFDSPEKFLVYSFLVEEIQAQTKNNLVLEHLAIQECSNVELNRIYTMADNVDENLPKISDVKRSYLVENNSAINWALLEEEKKYHSVFWMESESKLFGRCA